MIWIFLIAAGIPLGALLWHKDEPHEDAIGKELFVEYTKRIDDKITVLDEKMDELKEEIKKLSK